MIDNLKKYSFSELVEEQHKIRIPKIQRDYAQGRINENVNEIRKTFVHTLIAVVKGKRADTELDFVYGSTKDEAFEPLDGQQRLTTLYLLHWMLGVNLVTDDGRHSIFSYETRNTSEEFCDEIVTHESKLFIKESLDKKSVPSKIIIARDWFKWEWKFDPTVSSMLVMLDAIYDELLKDFVSTETVEIESKLKEWAGNLNNITFNRLNLGMFGLSNELFIKMNARGKQLSDFDKLKSTIEEELQIQQGEVHEDKTLLATSSDEEQWRSLMDGVWIDLFWHKYARRVIEDTEAFPKDERRVQRLQSAKFAEIQFKKLILRLIALQLFENQNANDNLLEASYNINEDVIDKIISVYTDELLSLRSEETHKVVESKYVTINFHRLIADMNLLIYKDKTNDTFYEFSYLLPEASHIEKDNRSIFDMFLEKKVGNDVMLVFYSMLLFLRAFPPVKEIDEDIKQECWFFEKEKHSAWLANLTCWLKSMRNIHMNDNINQRIDKRYLTQEAVKNLNELVEDLKSFIKKNDYDVESNATIIIDFFRSIELHYPRLDNQSLIEEKNKAELIFNDSKWNETLEDAETHEYLWGQIRCLLDWCRVNNKYDIELFKRYSKKLTEVLDYVKCNPANYYAVILGLFPGCWKNTNRLYQLNRDRDNSIKRFLRDKSSENMVYGDTIKSLIDLWIQEDYDAKFENFVIKKLEKNKQSNNSLVYVVSNSPQILEEAWNRKIYMAEKDHIVLAQRKTEDSHCFDPIFLYFRELCKQNHFDDNKYTLFDSKSTPTHEFHLNNSIEVTAKWSDTDDKYSLTIEGQEEQELTSIDLIKKMEEIIKKEQSSN